MTTQEKRRAMIDRVNHEQNVNNLFVNVTPEEIDAMIAQEENMPEYAGRQRGNVYSEYGESIIVNGYGVTIDRTHDAIDWNKRHGLAPEYNVTTDRNEKFTVWTSYYRNQLQFAVAIPA